MFSLFSVFIIHCNPFPDLVYYTIFETLFRDIVLHEKTAEGHTGNKKLSKLEFIVYYVI